MEILEAELFTQSVGWTLWRLEFLAYQPCRLLPVPASPGNELPDAYENIVFFKSILAYFSRKREVYKLCYK